MCGSHKHKPQQSVLIFRNRNLNMFSVDLDVSEPHWRSNWLLSTNSWYHKSWLFLGSLSPLFTCNIAWQFKLAATLRIGAEILELSSRAAFLVNFLLQGKKEDEALRSIWWHDPAQHHASWRIMRSDRFYNSGFRCIYRWYFPAFAWPHAMSQ